MSVVFAVPSYSKQPCFEHTLAALATLDACKNAGIPSKWRYRPGDPYLSKCRSILATEFVNEHPESEDFFFIDDDVGWPCAAVMRALGRDEDVIVGVYPKKQYDIVDEPLYRKDGIEIPAGTVCWREPLDWPASLLLDESTKRPIWKDGLVLAGLAATGFMRIKRRVLEACVTQSGVYPHQDSAKGLVECYDLFRSGFVPDAPEGKHGRWWGEDFFFSFMVRHLGFEVWIDPDIEFTHSGQHTWTGNFIREIARRDKLAAGGAWV